MNSRALFVALAASLVSSTAWATGTHAGGHYTFGEPGKEADVTRVIEVIADDSDGMIFRMDMAPIKQGETIKFIVTNQGAGEHEFSIGDVASQRSHAKLMAKNPEMKHDDDPSAVSLAPAESATLIWKFNKPVATEIVFACQMPGHYEAGMVHKVEFVKTEKSSPST